MNKLLYLVHRIPYPPNKGDKIRSFNWLKGLAENHKIYLGTFVDDENDWQYLDQLHQYCEDVYVEKLEPGKAKLKSLVGLLSGEPLTLPYYKNQNMQAWTKKTMEEEDIKNILVFSSSMAQYIDSKKYSDICRVVDFVDMDSDKWVQYAEKKQWPMSWVYQREARTLLSYEKEIAKKFDKSVFVSEKEADFFSETLKDNSISVDYVNNGVDTDYFSNNIDLLNPFEADDKIIVFTGAMDYWANVDAVKWFANEIFPIIRKKINNVRFVIVGSKPTSEVLSLESIKGVTVTGFVEDVRPYILHADLAVAPMRIARGIQNKVLEAMSMGKIVIASPQGFEGIKAKPGVDLLLCNDGQDWISQVAEVILDPDDSMGISARSCVLTNYSWHSNITKLASCFEEKSR